LEKVFTNQNGRKKMKEKIESNNPQVYIPKNEVIMEYSNCDIVELLRKYKDDPVAIMFIANMLEA
jgi:hypothetical protein